MLPGQEECINAERIVDWKCLIPVILLRSVFVGCLKVLVQAEHAWYSPQLVMMHAWQAPVKPGRTRTRRCGPPKSWKGEHFFCFRMRLIKSFLGGPNWILQREKLDEACGCSGCQNSKAECIPLLFLRWGPGLAAVLFLTCCGGWPSISI